MHCARGLRRDDDTAGAVLIELLAVVLLFVLLVWGVTHYSAVRREELILSDALASGVRAIAMTGSFVGYESMQAEYVNWRYKNAVVVARYIISQNGLDPDTYNYNVFTSGTVSLGGDPGGSRVQFNISGREAAAGIFGGRRVCLGNSILVEGLVLPAGAAVVDPALDSDCNPGDA